jgi:hypothetical protein
MLLHNNAFYGQFVASNNETGTSFHIEVPGAASDKRMLVPSCLSTEVQCD